MTTIELEKANKILRAQLDEYRRTIEFLRQEGFATDRDDSDLVLSVVRQWVHNEKNHLGII